MIVYKLIRAEVILLLWFKHNLLPHVYADKSFGSQVLATYQMALLNTIQLHKSVYNNSAMQYTQ